MKLNKEEMKEARYVVRECILSRFSRNESLAYLQQKLKRNDITFDQLDYLIRTLKNDTQIWIKSMMKTRYAYVSQYKERIDEYLRYQKEYWRLYYLNRNNPMLQKLILDSLQDTTESITELYDILPEITTGYMVKDDPLSKSTEKEIAKGTDAITTTINNNESIPPIE